MTNATENVPVVDVHEETINGITIAYRLAKFGPREIVSASVQRGDSVSVFSLGDTVVSREMVRRLKWKSSANITRDECIGRIRRFSDQGEHVRAVLDLKRPSRTITVLVKNLEHTS